VFLASGVVPLEDDVKLNGGGLPPFEELSPQLATRGAQEPEARRNCTDQRLGSHRLPKRGSQVCAPAERGAMPGERPTRALLGRPPRRRKLHDHPSCAEPDV
jgi:hypothetical protein